MTRIGNNSKMIFIGDHIQTDLKRESDKQGFLDFFKIVEHMAIDFSIINFQVEDIVRSETVKRYIIAKMELNL